MADSDVSVSSSSSDEDFLTLGAGKGGETRDREALVRKMLMENFYGRDAVADAVPAASTDDDGDDFLNDDGDDDDSPSKLTGSGRLQSTEDLDSPAFDADAHTRHHIKNSSMQTLLDTEERLALSVRTLDTEMQALVYENYTRFIDATDAIRSIGVNVNANEPGLDRLSTGMARIDENSKKIEESLGVLRDQVAEKIRIKRLLTRLDTLLNLPQTLREQIANGDCRSACKQFLQASSILSKHSEGFESLRSIEAECNLILEELKVDLNRKISCWSGRATGDDGEGGEPDAPKCIRDIFECSGTLYLLSKESGEDEEHAMELQQMSLSASMRFIDRLLDTHLITIQERRFNSTDMDPSIADVNLGASASSIRADAEVDPTGLVARDVLACILEVARLWASSFGEQFAGDDDITTFVSEAFMSFLMQEKAILLDESMYENAQDENEARAKGVSVALAILVRSVQDMAQCLAQPDIGIAAHFTSSLVEQTRSLTDALVRRRVDQKFTRLRLSIVENCLLPFASRSMQERTDSIAYGRPQLDGMMQIANVTLSDCLQLVDDTIRGITAPDGASTEPSVSSDIVMTRAAVHSSTARFATWLANAFEMLAGEESCDPLYIIDTEALDQPSDGAADGASGRTFDAASDLEDTDETAKDARTVASLLDQAKEILKADGYGDGCVHPDFILSIAELCRLAQGSVVDMLEQSMHVQLVGHKKKSKGMFEDGKTTSDEFAAIAQRFQVASSRLLVLYSANRGAIVADRLLDGLWSLDDTPSLGPPCGYILDALQLVKEIADECSQAFGEFNWTGPVPDSSQDDFSPLSLAATTMSRKTGLYLDVERMFKEKVVILPHPGAVVSRHPCDVTFLVLKVAFKSLLETMRTATISGSAYRQLLVDIGFLKSMVSLYAKSDYIVNGSQASGTLTSLLSDVMDAAGERCLDVDIVESDQAKQQSTDILNRFLSAKDKDEVLDRIIVQHKDAA